MKGFAPLMSRHTGGQMAPKANDLRLIDQRMTLLANTRHLSKGKAWKGLAGAIIVMVDWGWPWPSLQLIRSVLLLAGWLVFSSWVSLSLSLTLYLPPSVYLHLRYIPEESLDTDPSTLKWREVRLQDKHETHKPTYVRYINIWTWTHQHQYTM